MTFDINNHDLLKIHFIPTDEHRNLLVDIHDFKIAALEKDFSVDPQIISEKMQKAFDYVFQAAKEGKSFSRNDICKIHKLIESEGEFRTPEKEKFTSAAVWFGTDYPYFPVDANDLPVLMEKYENRHSSFDKTKEPLEEICAAYFIFQLIHPFSDGNGRTARLICIWLMLQSNYEFLTPSIEKCWANDHHHRIKIFQSPNNNYVGCLSNPVDLNAHFSDFYLYFLKEIKDLLGKFLARDD